MRPRLYSFSLAYNRACSASGIPGSFGFALSEFLITQIYSFFLKKANGFSCFFYSSYFLYLFYYCGKSEDDVITFWSFPAVTDGNDGEEDHCLRWLNEIVILIYLILFCVQKVMIMLFLLTALSFRNCKLEGTGRKNGAFDDGKPGFWKIRAGVWG